LTYVRTLIGTSRLTAQYDIGATRYPTHTAATATA
jgi:hypothetical protein